MYSHNRQFITSCKGCGRNTSKKYAREHNGQCKVCVEPESARPSNTPTREERILEHGYQAYAREEGHYV